VLQRENMSIIVETAPSYEKFKSTLIDIKTIFHSGGESIHKARNELKIMELHNISCVVKAFRVPNIINQFAYAYIRKSKAYKSYHNSMRLGELGVNTPQAIGYIEFYKNTFLKESFFISKTFEYELTMANVRDDNLVDKKQVLEAFAKFTYEIHQKGVWHVDYSGGNILINRKDDSYEFSLVDINRMEFKTINTYEGLENFNKMWFDETALTIIAQEYAKQASLDEARAIQEILEHDAKLKAHVLRRRKFKAILKGKS